MKCGFILLTYLAGFTLGALLANAATPPDPTHYTINKDTITFNESANGNDLAVLDEHSKISVVDIHASMRWRGGKKMPLPYTDADFAHVAHCTKLKTLQLDPILPLNITDDAFSHLANLTELRSLTSGATPMSDNAIAHLAKLNLEKLDLSDQSVLCTLTHSREQ